MKTSAKSEQKSGREISLGFSAWGRNLLILGEKSIENVFQLMMGFHFCNQGIPRIIWGQERQMTMNLTMSEKGPEEKEMMEVQQIVPDRKSVV